MENKGVLTKVLAIAGTLLVWLPILAPIFFSIASWTTDGVFRLDYLMPAELFFFVLAGGGLLIWAAIRAHSQLKLIGWGLGISVAVLVGGQALAVATGLADGTTPIGGWQWMLVLASLAVLWAAVIAAGVGGVLLVRDAFKRSPIVMQGG